MIFTTYFQKEIIKVNSLADQINAMEKNIYQALASTHLNSVIYRQRDHENHIF
jgi:hypothetical protein